LYICNKGDFLKFVDPQWISTLAKGMNWIVGAIVASIALSFLSFALSRKGASTIIPSILNLGFGFSHADRPTPTGINRLPLLTPGRFPPRRIFQLKRCQGRATTTGKPSIQADISQIDECPR